MGLLRLVFVFLLMVITRYALGLCAILLALGPWFLMAWLDARWLGAREPLKGALVVGTSIGSLVAAFAPVTARPRRTGRPGRAGLLVLAFLLLVPVAVLFAAKDVATGPSHAVDPSRAWFLLPETVLKQVLMFLAVTARPPRPGESPGVAWKLVGTWTELLPIRWNASPRRPHAHRPGQANS